MTDKKPEDAELGSGLADQAKRHIMSRKSKIDAAVEGKPSPKTPKPKSPPKKHQEKSGVGRDMAAKNRKRLIKQLDARISAARGANNMDLVNKYMARKKALKSL
jgi:hypothetical protein